MQIPDEMHQTAHGLHGAGLISKRRLGEFDALCRLDVQMPTQKLKALREDCRLSQAVFATVLNASLSTVQKWEVGDKRPSSPSLKLIELDGEQWRTAGHRNGGHRWPRQSEAGVRRSSPLARGRRRVRRRP
jgi:putative transcriptional regulator